MKEISRTEKYQQMYEILNEKQWRQYLALETKEGKKLEEVAGEAGVSKNTIRRGIRELEAGDLSTAGGRIRKGGGGRKKVVEKDETLLGDLEGMLDPKGDPMSLLKWTTKSVAHLKEALQEKGHQIADTAIRRLLRSLGYSLRANKKNIEGQSHPDRNAQFEHITSKCKEFEEKGNPIISVDCKKKELLGNFKNNGREWQAKGEETRVNVYDFLSVADGKALPYGIYDVVHKSGFVKVGIDHDTAEFAVASIRRWWHQCGKALYPDKKELLITADGGGSNGARTRLWKKTLQELANEEQLTITVAHYPPATSKWNKIEHRLFSFISINWRAKPLLSLEVILELISATTTETGLTVTAVKDGNTYPTGIKVSDEELAALNLLRDSFHGEWNYTIQPQPSPMEGQVISAGPLSAHKSETDPGDLGWQAFGTRHGQRTHVQLGSSHALTLELLQAAAQTLAGEHASVEPPEVGQAAFAASLHQGSQTAAPVGSPSSLIRAKLYRPRSGSDVISRPHLLERLTAGLSGKVTLLSAPAGFGKTTLLAEWLHTLNRQVAWLSLDASDDALPLFVQALTAALQSVWSDAFLATASLPSSLQFPPLAEVATLFLNDLADVPDDLVLVLDDYHFIHNRDVHRLLELLIDQLPPQVHLVLSARFDPPLPLVRWSASGQLNELRTADLRFTLAETHAFLARLLGNTLANETAVALGKHAEGWIAVLRLAALSLRSTADRAAFLDRLQHAPDRSVSQYLLEEILAQQAPLVQEVLLRSSLLEQFCAEVCVALLGDETSHAEVQATLNWLEGMNLFLVPLDEHQGWYRLHHLFQNLLQQRLRKRSSAEELAELHRRASAWYAGQGLLDEAVHHALAAGDAREAARLVEAHVLPAFDQDQWWPMERWLRLLPEEQVQANPGLLVARAWVSWIRGQLQDMPPLLRAAERLIATSGGELPDPSGLASQLLHALIAVLWSCVQFYTGQVQPCLHSALSALERLSPEEEYVASCALVMLAQARQAAGQEEVALAELHQALRAQPARPAITARLLFAQGDVYLAAGKLPQLEHTARHILTLAREADLAVTQNWVQWALGVVSYEWNHLDAAVYHFSAVLADRHRAHTWTVREAMYGLALAYQAQGLGIRAHETTEALLDWVQGQHNLPELLSAYAFCGELALRRGEVEAAAQWLELAGEQEVLGPMDLLEDAPFTRARMLLVRGDQASVAQGQALLDELVQHVEAVYNTPKTIKVLALQAWASELQGRLSEALDVLERALARARPGGFVRTFADLPPMARLLQEVRKRCKAQQRVDKALDAYVQRLLVAMSPGAAAGVAPDELLRREGLEPLTERELHILGLLDKDLTNKEIARELVVTPGTVKVHTTNLYRKLNVNNRRAAVTLAKALGLLASDQAPTSQVR